MNIQSILLPKENICTESDLYFHEEGIWQCFDGYFNLFYIEKHKKYTAISGLSLKLSLKGYESVALMHDDECIAEYVTGGTRAEIREYSYNFPYIETEKGVFWFKLKKDPLGEQFVSGCFMADSDKKNEVFLGVDICTYRREPYVYRNMKSLTEYLAQDAAKDIASEIKVFLIDNGQTLSENRQITELTANSSFISIIPNANTGGCGGFTRGMIEAMDLNERHITHLLLMDDDAVFDPDLFTRLIGFLTFVKPEYAEMTVGGALIREDYPYLFQACGEWYENFSVKNDHMLTDLRKFENCRADWMCSADNDKKFYGGWWCCCYPMSQISRDSLPIPIFVRHDDIQFGLKRADNGIVFLNGIGVWHKGFETDFPGVKQYYDMRNSLVTESLFEPWVSPLQVIKWASKRAVAMLICLRYAESHMVYMGIMDFLKGAEWFRTLDHENNHKEIASVCKKEFPLAEISTEVLSDNPGISEEIKKYSAKLSPDDIDRYYNHSGGGVSAGKMITFNGHLLPGIKETGFLTPLDSSWNAYRRKKVFMYEPSTGKGCLIKRSGGEFMKAIGRIIKMDFAILFKYKKTAEGFRNYRS